MDRATAPPPGRTADGDWKECGHALGWHKLPVKIDGFWVIGVCALCGRTCEPKEK